MPIKVRCQECQKALKLPDAAAGKSVKCPGCSAKIRVPAGSRQRAKAPAKEKSSDFLSALGQLSHEDVNNRICPRCGTQLYEGESECHNCGVDYETGQLSERRQKLANQTGPDPAEYYKGVFHDVVKFPFKNGKLSAVYGFVFCLIYLMGTLCWYTMIGSASSTLGLFSFATLMIATSVPVGMGVGLCKDLIFYTFKSNTKRALQSQKKKKFVSSKFDFFLAAQNGFKLAIWYFTTAVPILIILSPIMLIGILVLMFTTGIQGIGLSLVTGIPSAVGLLVAALGIPIAVAHFAMPIENPAWNPIQIFKTVKRIPFALFYWLFVCLLTMLVPLVLFMGAYLYFQSDIQEVVADLEFNREVKVAKMIVPGMPEFNANIKKWQAEEERLINYEPVLIAESCLLLLVFIPGFLLPGLVKLTSSLIYYHDPSLELIKDAKDTVYKVFDRDKFLPIPKNSQATMIVVIVGLINMIPFVLTHLMTAFDASIDTEFIYPVLGLFFSSFGGPSILFLQGCCRVLEKARKPGLSIVIWPIGFWHLFKIAGVSVIWYMLIFVPVLNIVAFFYLSLKLAERFDKPIWFGLGMGMFPPIFYHQLGTSMTARARRLADDPPKEYDPEDAY